MRNQKIVEVAFADKDKKFAMLEEIKIRQLSKSEEILLDFRDWQIERLRVLCSN
ncbi:MAG: hypothetical protein MUE81_09625 [Thermoflexibacter sp.]|nr:hypothetical protein [Thermoflexibacter sp.]